MESLHGDVSPGESLTVHFGGAHEWDPDPVGAYQDGELIDDDADIDWSEVSPDDFEFDVREEYFASDTHIGLGLYHHVEPMEAWSPTGEPVFSIGDDGLSYPERSFQCVDAPWEGKSLEELAAGIDSCATSDEAMQRRMHKEAEAFDDPRRYVAANCIVMGDDDPEENLENGQCILESHCEPYVERCVDGECIEADCTIDDHCVDPDEVCEDHQCVLK